MSQKLNLYRLQQLDSRIDRARVRLLAIQKKLEDDVVLRQASELARTTGEARQSAEQALRQAEAAVKAQKIKIEQTESSLYSGTVHNPKELQDLQNDVASLRRHLSTLEDRQLEAMITLEDTEAISNKAQAQLQAAQKQWAEQNRDLHQEQEGLLKETDTLSTQRMAVTESIPEESITLYNRLRQQHNGVAVATLSDSSCDACGAGLTAALIQAARSAGQTINCPSCGRILYGI
jgi:uncharacterized protein